MLFWSVRNKKPKEFFGQCFRIIGAATKTFLGLIPQGNTGESNVNPFKVMPIHSQFQSIIKVTQGIEK